jgi:hypothetical protein
MSPRRLVAPGRAGQAMKVGVRSHALMFVEDPWCSLSGGPGNGLLPVTSVTTCFRGAPGLLLSWPAMTKRWLACMLALALAGCASSKSGNGVADAATTPLSDLNLVRAEIPPVLLAAREKPYALPAAGRGCAELAREIAQLDAVLGADLDTPAGEKPGLLERGSDAVGDAATKALRDTAASVIPFRGWVRRLTGAERYERGVAAAITAGGVRRAFLKGLAVDCPKPTPAAPLPAAAASAAS